MARERTASPIDTQLRTLLSAEKARREAEVALRLARAADLQTLSQLREHALQGSDTRVVTSVLTVESTVMGAPLEPVLEMMVPEKKQALKKAKVAQAPGRAPEQSPDFLTEHPEVAAFLADSANSVDGWIAVEDVAQLFVRRDGKEADAKLRFISIRRGMMLWQEDKANKGAISRGTSKGRPIMVAADRAWEVIRFVDERYAESPRSTYRLVDSEVAPKKA